MGGEEGCTLGNNLTVENCVTPGKRSVYLSISQSGLGLKLQRPCSNASKVERVCNATASSLVTGHCIAGAAREELPAELELSTLGPPDLPVGWDDSQAR